MSGQASRRGVARHGGFTLIEVLIAMAVTVLVLAGAFMTFSNLAGGLESLRAAGGRAREIERAWMLLSRDLRQFAHRPVRNELGDSEAALWGGELADDSLNLTRTGWHNSRQRPRGNLERVRYRLEDGVLYRESYAVLDRTNANEPRQVALLSGVERFHVHFLGASETILPGAEWDVTNWPRNWGTDSYAAVAGPPLALAVVLEVDGFGEVMRLFEVPGA